MFDRCLSRLRAAWKPFAAGRGAGLRIAAPPRALRHRYTAGFSLVAAAHFAVLPASAQESPPGRSIAIVRDAETEQLMRDYLRPILGAAGLPSGATEVVLVNDSSFNAFVADSHRIFINTGVITQAKTPNEVIGVLAHETGHIAGNHLARMHQAASQAGIIAAIGMIAGAGALVAGAAAGNGSVAGGGAAAITGGIGLGQRSLLSYQRGEEDAADRSALTFLQRTKQSAKGMIDTFKRLANEQLMIARYADPYAQSHPMARDRIANLETKAEASPYWDVKDPPALQARHDMVRAKLIAFTSSPQTALRQYPPSNTSLPARYARAVVAYRMGDPQEAQRQVDALIKSQPSNPYFWELKGQAMLDLGNPRGAIAPLQKAVSLAPSATPIRALYGQALVGAGDPASAKQAVTELNRVVQADPDDASAFRFLAMAYGAQGQTAMADLATARGMAAQGQLKQASHYAQRAKMGLKMGTPAWLQADDLVTRPSSKSGKN
ncbi:Putative Zn-dependent protease, contains TPR repeats [Pseudoxanthobacter soli DSM 19599]|uniref:Putative Zn-dependent protease, contains TPR repeats n=1 Tax=Pseudoxanthobacter soli DSM 19599 TaxID=1123029 RepID=A0A1M7Z8X5_9HYPH|nr:Putative Zn-dependent protease, contains TPR repeats [Pseudoxanthobacter soli DSM 19599]